MNKYELMTDKNGATMRTGDIVKIENAYFKSYNGFYFIDRSPGDFGWFGHDYSLWKISKCGKISTAKYHTEFWPLKSFMSDRSKNAAANEHNKNNATIEIVHSIDRKNVVSRFEHEIEQYTEQAEFHSRCFGTNAENQFWKSVAFLKDVIERIKAEDSKKVSGAVETDAANTDAAEADINAEIKAESESGAEPSEIGPKGNDSEPGNNSEPAASATAFEENSNPGVSAADETSPQETESERIEDLPDNYYIENKETGKIELHFDKDAYLNLSNEQKNEIKRNFLFSRYSHAWISRRKFPNLYLPKQIAESLGLENAGKKGERLTFEEQQERIAEKAESRANRMERKADKSIKNAERLQAPINKMHGDIAFFTQPNINTSAGRAFTRQRNKMWDSYEKGIEEFRKSDYYKQRAESARETAERTKTADKGYCQRRIDEAKAKAKMQQNNIAFYNSILDSIKNGENPTGFMGEPYEPQKVQMWIEEANEILNESLEKIAYYDALIQESGGIIDKDSINPGDIVKISRYGNTDVRVIRKGSKNITFEFLEPHMKLADGTQMQGKASYAEILEIVKSA